MAKFNATFSQTDSSFKAVFNQPGIVNVGFDSVVEIESKSTPIYDGDVFVIPNAHNAVVLQTANKKVLDDITVSKVPFYEVSNDSGNTVYIASEVSS